MNALHRAPARKPSLQDAIVAYLRERPEGVPPCEVAERFLKMKAPDPKMAAAAIAGMLGADRRCFTDADRRWHASEGGAQPADALCALPWMVVYCLTDPGARRLLYLALWEITPSLSCLGSGWLADPRSLPYDEREVLQSAADGPFSRGAAGALLAAAAGAGGNRLPVFMSSQVRGLVAAACLTYGETLSDDTVLASQLLKATGTAVPRPLTLEAFETTVLGSEQGGASARKRSERFAAALVELLQTLAGKGIESRDQLDRCLRDSTAPLFAGKEFTYDTLLALPPLPGVYGFKDAADAYLYIGKTNNLKRRVLSYFGDSDESPGKLERLRADSRSLTVHPCGSELECLIYEYRLVRKYMPPLNRQTEISERKGTFRPIDDCIVLLPHAAPDKGMSVWFRQNQKILLKPFSGAFDTDSAFVTELNAFFFSQSLPSAFSDFPEQEIAVRWIKRHADTAAIVPVSRQACAEEIYDAMRIAWRDRRPPS